MRYRSLNKVKSPRDLVKKVEVLFDDPQSVSMAKIKWDGKNRIGIRWNVAHREWSDNEKSSGIKECLGLPISNGFPTWFILPEEMFDANSELGQIIQKFIK